jgi:hypothetical protein
VSTDPAQPALLTSLTYQAVTLPGRDHTELDTLTKGLWVERLMEQGEVNSPEEAAAWIDDLSTHNPTYYQVLGYAELPARFTYTPRCWDTPHISR